MTFKIGYGFDRAVFCHQNHFGFGLRWLDAHIYQISPGSLAKIGGISPVLPRSILPTFNASNICGPAGNSTRRFLIADSVFPVTGGFLPAPYQYCLSDSLYVTLQARILQQPQSRDAKQSRQRQFNDVTHGHYLAETEGQEPEHRGGAMPARKFLARYQDGFADLA